QQGIANMKTAFTQLQANGMKEQAMNIADSLARFYTRTSNYREATRYYATRNAYSDSLSKEKGRIDAQRLEYDYELEEKEARIALLEKDKDIIEGQQYIQNLLLAGAVAGMLLSIIIAILVFRNLRHA